MCKRALPQTRREAPSFDLYPTAKDLCDFFIFPIRLIFLIKLVSVEIKPSSEADKRIQEDCAPGKPFSVFTVQENQVCLQFVCSCFCFFLAHFDFICVVAIDVAKKKKALNDWPEGKQFSFFPRSQSLSVLLYLPNSKIEKKTEKNCLLDASWNSNLPRFQGARPDNERVESCCFPRELVRFDQRHVTRSPPIGKRI